MKAHVGPGTMDCRILLDPLTYKPVPCVLCGESIDITAEWHDAPMFVSSLLTPMFPRPWAHSACYRAMVLGAQVGA